MPNQLLLFFINSCFFLKLLLETSHVHRIYRSISKTFKVKGVWTLADRTVACRPSHVVSHHMSFLLELVWYLLLKTQLSTLVVVPIGRSLSSNLIIGHESLRYESAGKIHSSSWYIYSIVVVKSCQKKSYSIESLRLPLTYSSSGYSRILTFKEWCTC